MEQESEDSTHSLKLSQFDSSEFLFSLFSSKSNPSSGQLKTCIPTSNYSFDGIPVVNPTPKSEPKPRTKKKFNELLRGFRMNPQEIQKKLVVHLLGFLQEAGKIEHVKKRTNPLMEIITKATDSVTENMRIQEQMKLYERMFATVNESFDQEMYDFAVPSSSIWRTKDKTQQFKSVSKKYWRVLFHHDIIRKCFFLMLLVILKCHSAGLIKHLGVCTRRIKDEDLETLKFALWDYFILLIPKEVNYDEIKDLRKEIG